MPSGGIDRICVLEQAVKLSMLDRDQIVYNAAEGRFYESKIEVLSSLCNQPLSTPVPFFSFPY